MALAALAPSGTAARARALTVAAHVRGLMLGENDAAAPLADEGLGIWRALGDAHGLAVALERRGRIAIGTGDYQRATALFSEARARFRELGGASGPRLPIALYLAEVAQAQGDRDKALTLNDEALAEARARGDRHAMAYALRERARLRRTQGSDEQAVALLRESLALLEPLRDLRCAQICLDDLAGVLCERGRPADVARLFAAGEALRALMGRSLTRAQLVTHDRDVATVEHRLDPESFAAAWAEGRAMSLEQAIAYALEVEAPACQGRSGCTESAPAAPVGGEGDAGVPSTTYR